MEVDVATFAYCIIVYFALKIEKYTFVQNMIYL